MKTSLTMFNCNPVLPAPFPADQRQIKYHNQASAQLSTWKHFAVTNVMCECCIQFRRLALKSPPLGPKWGRWAKKLGRISYPPIPADCRLEDRMPTYPTWALVGGTSRPAGDTVLPMSPCFSRSSCPSCPCPGLQMRNLCLYIWKLQAEDVDCPIVRSCDGAGAGDSSDICYQ